MSTPHDPHRDDGLSEDERAFERTLAARLARAGGPREPSAALDAAILAAARAAVDGPTAAHAAVAPAAVATAAASPTAVAPAATPQPSQPSSALSAERSSVVALPPRKPKPRWPLGLSLAASLVLAAGIGIKLYDGGLSHDTAASAEAAADSAAAYEQEAPEPMVEAILIDPPMQREPPPPPPPLEDAAAQAKRVARGNSAEFATAPQASAATEADAAASDMGAMAEAVPAPSAPPPPPVAARMAEPARQGVADEENSLDRVEVTGSRIGDARNVGAAEHTRTPLSERRREATDVARAAEAQREAAKAERLRRQDSVERRAVVAPPPPPPPAPVAASPPRPAPAASAPPPAGARTAAGSGFVAAPPADKAADAEAAEGLYDDRPPVTADSPEFRQAWLQRIRKLVTDGRRAEARASLLEFRRRYPEAAVPDDLRPLLTPEPTPPTP